MFDVFFDGLGIFLIVFGSLEREIVEILSILKWMGFFSMAFGGFLTVFGTF